MRQLVTIRTVQEVHPIEGADVIEVAVIDGWRSIVKKEYGLQPGVPCVYFEIDSFLPMEERYEFLRQSSFKRMGEQDGIRLKTMRLRGVLSQGLALPFSMFKEEIQSITNAIPEGTPAEEVYQIIVKQDWTALLGVQLYEPYIPPDQMGKIRGNFPSFVRKTDQERCQNNGNYIFADSDPYKSYRYEVSMKLDGTSFTGFKYNDRDGVCSRNNELDQEDADNKYVNMFVNSKLKEVLNSIGRNYAVQGELMGPSIQKNREEMKVQKLYVFDIFDIDAQKQLPPEERIQFMDTMYKAGLDSNLVQHVPILHNNVSLEELGIANVDQLLQFAEGASIKHPIREGLVFKSMDGQFTFKAISNQYLLKQKD